MKTLIIVQLFIFTCSLCPFIVSSQTNKEVRGTIYSDATKQTIGSANVVSKLSGKTVMANEGGFFVFSGIVDSDTLIISSVGYMSQEIPVIGIGAGQLAIYLNQSMIQIDEVIVNTGYQAIPKERATGSFTHIDNKLFERSVSTDIISRLEGVTNGLSYERPRTGGEPSSTPDLRVRGLSTINGETGPLIIVDNFPYEGDVNNINPNDVESITILKDAAAASIWGARAGNGVIVITTKRGVSSPKSTISFNSNLSLIEKPDLFYDQRFLPPSEAVELEREFFIRGLYGKDDWDANTPAMEVLIALDEGHINATTANGRLDELKRYDLRKQAARHLYRQGVNQQYAMNVSGGAESHQYYLAAGFDNNAGNLVRDGYARISLSAKNDFQPLERLHIGTSINYVQSNLMNNGISMLGLDGTSPYVYMRLADEHGNALPVVRNNRLTYTDNAVGLGLLDWHYRPLDELKMNDNITKSQEIRLNTSASYNLWRGLNAELRYQYQRTGNSTRQHRAADSYFVRNEINRFTQEDGTRPVPMGGMLDRSGNTFTSHYGRVQVDYNERWGERHQLNALAGFELRHEQSMGDGSSRIYGYDNGVLTYVPDIDFNSTFPVRPRLNFSRIPNNSSPGGQFIDRFVSYYANMGYSLASKYLLSGSVRWDASNIFGVDFNQKGVPLWSAGVAWNMSDEPFFKAEWVDLAKLRLTYGSNGNAIRTMSALPFVHYGSTNLVSRVPSARLSSVGNPDLSWEQVNTTNVGFDFAMLKRRFSGSVEWYNKQSKNLIGEDFIDPTTGVIELGGGYNLDNRRNYADLRTRGVDIELNTVNTNRAVKWQTTVLVSYVANKITNYFTPSNVPATKYLEQAGIPVVEGYSKDQLYALPWHGLDENGSPQVTVNGELSTDYNTYFNNLSQEDLLKIGVSRAPYFGSIRNTFTWGAFSAGVNLTWKGGYGFRRETIVYNWLLGPSRVMHVDYLRRWKKPGDELVTSVPSMPQHTDLRRDHAYIFSEELVESGNHVRLQDISLSYQLPRRHTERIGLSQVRLYGYARNLGIIWKHTKLDMDPDVRALYPQPLQVSLGLQIQL